MNVFSRERETVKRLVNGDKDAFCELYAAYKTGVVRFAVRMLKSMDLAEDVFQDAFTVIWQSRQFINPDIPFSAYLFTIVRNRVLNILREDEKQDIIKTAMLSRLQQYEDITNETILVNDLILLIEKAKNNLTPQQRNVYELSREKHLSHQEIADRLHISKNTVREHITEALKQIRIFLNDHYKYSFIFLLFLD